MHRRWIVGASTILGVVKSVKCEGYRGLSQRLHASSLRSMANGITNCMMYLREGYRVDLFSEGSKVQNKRVIKLVLGNVRTLMDTKKKRPIRVRARRMAIAEVANIDRFYSRTDNETD